MAGKKLGTDGFRAELTAQVKEICAQRQWNYDNQAQRGYAFEYWVANLFCRRDQGIDSDPDESVFLSGDAKVDILLEDSNQKVIYFIQTKFVSPSSNPPLDETEVNDFFSRHQLFFDREWVTKHVKTEEQFEYLGAYKELLDDGYTFLYYFVSTGTASERIRNLAVSRTTAAARDFPGLQFAVLDFTSLKEYYIEAQTLEQSIPESVALQLPADRWIAKSKPYHTVVAIVKGNSLVNLYRKERERLFAYNIRSYLGKKGLNKDIIRTAESIPAEFYYYNNGVSAICTAFEIDDDNVLRAENFQIINGAQTIGALDAAKPNSDIEVLLRVTRGESVKTEKGFNANIIRYNNTQNVVKDSDFRSNDPIHLWLESKFKELRPRGAVVPVSYVRKRSGRRTRGQYPLRLEEAAKIRFAYMFEPTRAVADPKSLWTLADDGGFYEHAFGVHETLLDFWPDDEFSRFLLFLMFYIMLEKRVAEAIKKDRTNIYLKRLRYFAVGLFKEFLDIKMPDAPWDKLLRSEGDLRAFFDEFWREALRALMDAHHQATVEEKTTLFALARSEQRWRSTREKFVRYLRILA